MTETHSLSDFWWVDTPDMLAEARVGVAHHAPLTDEDDPFSTTWYRSLDDTGQPCPRSQLYPLNSLEQWREVCANTNVYRTLTIFDGDGKTSLGLGPFLIDVDNESRVNGYRSDLQEALEVARRTVERLTNHLGVHPDDMRLFFSGRKGFNIEVRPSAVRLVGTVDAQIERSGRICDDLRRAVRTASTTIDIVYGWGGDYSLNHPYTRLHSSINKWVDAERAIRQRLHLELTLHDFFHQPASAIMSRAEELCRPSSLPEEPS